MQQMPNCNCSPIGIANGTESLEEELRKCKMEVKILQLLAGGLISPVEFRSLMKMSNSVDHENLTVVEETVHNLMKQF